ncbi:MAG: twin-arginine translocase subunit TatC [Gammaproteobacteria bacterium]|nr:twin-arginine translocase subunit TatC [Gammaproteobacteria bacterium]
MPDRELPLVAHLIELRTRLMKIVVSILVILIALLPFSNDLYTFLAHPLMSVLPKGATMIATDVASPFLTPFKLTLISAVFLSVPVLLYHLWAFIAPGLYRHERRLALPLLISSVILFYCGMAFCYFVVFPLVFGFFTTAAPTGVTVMTDIAKYLDFVITLFFAFGVVFEVPIATILLVQTGMVTPEDLAAKRPYIIVAAFIIGMLLTPPDIFSQTLLAVPMIILFEIGLFVSRWIRRSAAAEEAADIEAAEMSAAATTVDDFDAEFKRAMDEEDKLNKQ